MNRKIVNFQEYKERKRREGISEGVQECLDVVEDCKNPESYGAICKGLKLPAQKCENLITPRISDF